MKLKTFLAINLILLSACSHPTRLSIAKMQLVGVWHENSSDAGSIKELIFRDDGTFSVTKIPFDVSKDYSGTYTIAPKKHILHLKITDSKYTPSDIDISNFHYSAKSQNELILTNGCFGSFNNNSQKKNRYLFLKGYE